jgi:hypothetical protein
MLNGKSAYTVSQEHVEFDGADITADIASAGLDPFTITTTPPLVDPEQGASSAFAHLKKRGAITTDQDGNNLAQWTAGRDISISLEGKAAAQLGLTYTARPAFATVQSLNELATRFSLSNYCVTPNSLRHLLDGVPTKTGFAVEAFTIPIGIGPLDASRRVRLSILSASAQAFLRHEPPAHLHRHDGRKPGGRAGSGW